MDSGESGLINEDRTVSSESRSVGASSLQSFTAENDEEQQVCLIINSDISVE